MEPKPAAAAQYESKVARRGLLAGIAALGGAALLKLTGAEKAQAADGGNIIIGAINNGSSRTSLITSAHPALLVNNGVNTFAYSGADGVQGITEQVGGAGVRGANSGGQAAGIVGESLSAGTAIFARLNSVGGSVPAAAANHAIFATVNSSATAIKGESPSGYAVWGVSAGAAGVLGTTAAAYAVQGAANSGIGGFFSSVSGLGVSGKSTQFVGVLGSSDNYIGLYAFGKTPGVPALYAENLAGSNRLAGQFYGDVQVIGNFSVTGVKAAAVTLPDGSQRLMYCQESPEAYFEDFGSGRLQGGVAQVNLDPEFASLVQRDNYMVFLTPAGDSRGLYVSRQDPQRFEVREQQGGVSSLSFSYRVVAKRKDIPGTRLARVDAGPASIAARVKPVAPVVNLPANAYGPTLVTPSGEHVDRSEPAPRPGGPPGVPGAR